VQALKLLAALHFKQPLPELRFDTPPMIRLGMETIIEQSGLVRSLVPEESLLDRVSPNRYADMPWTSWKPVAVEDDELEETGDDPAISQAKLLADDGGGGAYDVDNVTGIDGSGSMKSLVDELSVRGFDEEDSCDDISGAGGSRGVVSAGFVSRGGGGRPRTFRFGPRVRKNRRLTYRGINLESKKSERVNESHEKSIPIVTDKRFYKLIDWVTISLINALLKRSTDKRPVDIGSLAKELRVTPGTVKRTIRKLEKHLSNREGFKEALIELLAERHDLEIEKNQLDSLHASYIFYKISLEP
ncbi:MAG: hypothetical protein GY757_15280, partial [bacterium]|nr:hypothetical protein [bacterium]